MASTEPTIEPMVFSDRLSAAVHELAGAMVEDALTEGTPAERGEMAALTESALRTIVDSQMQGWTVVLKAPGDTDLFSD